MKKSKFTEEQIAYALRLDGTTASQRLSKERGAPHLLLDRDPVFADVAITTRA